MSNGVDIKQLKNLIKEKGFSGVVYLADNQEVLLSEAYGYRDRSNSLYNTMTTRFGIASGTKFFTALAIAKLIDEKLISLDSKVFDYIKYSFPTYSPDITVHHLLNHTSGIPDYYDEELVDDFDNFKVAIPWCELKKTSDYFAVFPHTSMKFKPGAKFCYCNSGYILLAAIIEVVTNQSFTDFVTSEILKKHGLSYSGFYPFNHLPENTACGYIDGEDGWITNIYALPIIGCGDGGAFTTVDDTNRLWDAFYNYRVLSKHLTDYILSNSIIEKEGYAYSFGMWIQKKAENTIRYITGCDGGVSFQSGVVTNSNLRYTVISNTTNGAWPIVKFIKASI